MSRLRKVLAGRSGEEYIDTVVLILCVILVLALFVKTLPVFIAKQQPDIFATGLCREAEIVGRIGSETNWRVTVLGEKTGFNPEAHWSTGGRTQLNEEVTVQPIYRYNLGLFRGFDSFSITPRTATVGKSEMYRK